jgi:hypothetical protein
MLIYNNSYIYNISAMTDFLDVIRRHIVALNNVKELELRVCACSVDSDSSLHQGLVQRQGL